MKILHLITGLNTGGAETFLHQLVSHMDPARFHNSVVSLIPPGFMGHALAESGVSVSHLGMRRGLPSPVAFFSLVAKLKKERPDVLQTWLYHADLMGAVAGRMARVPKVAWNLRCSYMDLAQYRRTTAWTLRANAKLSRWPDVIIANTEVALRHHRSLGYLPRRSEVIENGIDLKRFRPDENTRKSLRSDLGLSDEAVVIGHVGRFDPMKDHAGFVAAMGRVAALVPQARFVLCGHGVDWGAERLGQWLAQAGLVDRATLLGQRADVERVYQAMDILVSSSVGESFPNVVGEAMACGVPCVVTDVGSCAEMVEGLGRAVAPSDPEALAAATTHFATLDRERLAELGIMCRARIRRRHSLTEAVQQYEALYEDLAGF